MDLSGTWTVTLDPGDAGLERRWYAKPLGKGAPIPLPGTLDDAGYGTPIDPETLTYPGVDPECLVAAFGQRPDQRLDEMGRLVRKTFYLGPAWYEREVEIPAAWAGKEIRLRLERVIWESRAWVDGKAAGRCDSLTAPHLFRLGALAPGRHRITLRVDNRQVLPTGFIQHGYGEETQPRWNGVAGRLCLEALDPLWIERVRIFPAADRRSVEVRIRFRNTTGRAHRARLRLRVQREGGPVAGTAVLPVEVPADTEGGLGGGVELPAPAEPWDEFHPALYTLTATLETAAGDRPLRHTLRETFGFRRVERDGARIRVNGRKVFLRGVLDCAVYPKAAHPPMALQSWMRVMAVIKGYGFNLVRYHTWCPPEAAFEAADRLGIYLCPEAAFWPPGGPKRAPQLGEDEAVLDWIRAEVRRISDAYGNHPSFCFFCIGNEFAPGTHWDAVNEVLRGLKAYDPRRLYTGSTARTRVEEDDFRVTHATENGSTRGIGPPRTDWDFRKAEVDLPVISHETGQRPSFPNYEDLLYKFTGPLLPLDLERYRRKADAAGVAPWIPAFARASVLFALDQYKAEHEAMLRTPGWDGYELLQLNDFTGQGEALVGLLDPFWDPKPGITPEKVRTWNGPVTPLARFGKYVFTREETLEAEIVLANYGPRDLGNAEAQWTLRADGEDTPLAAGVLGPFDAPTGEVTPIGRIAAPLTACPVPCGVTLSVEAGGGANRWRFWIYPPAGEEDTAPPEGIVVTERWDKAARDALDRGGRVLLLFHGLENEHTVHTGYASVYWSAKMFAWEGNNQLGVYPAPGHPALRGFPHDGHGDWHWWELTRSATALRLDVLPEGCRPIVQAVPDFHDPRPLLHLFEARVGKGRLLACGYDLASDLEHRPVARRLRAGLLRYMAGGAFAPTWNLPPERAREFFTGWTPDPRSKHWRVIAVDSEETSGVDNRGRNALDGNPRSIWHTEWVHRNPPPPHFIEIDLGREERVAGLRYLPRRDGVNGRVARYRIEVSRDGKRWTVAAEGAFPRKARAPVVRFDRARPARYVRFTALSEVNGKPWTSAAEITPLLDD